MDDNRHLNVDNLRATEELGSKRKLESAHIIRVANPMRTTKGKLQPDR